MNPSPPVSQTFRMARGHRLFTAAVLAAVALLLALPVIILAALFHPLRWWALAAIVLVVFVCECYLRQMLSTITVTAEAFCYQPGGTVSRWGSHPRSFPWREYAFIVYRAQPRERTMKVWRGIWLPVYMTNPGVPLRTLQFYTDSFLGMYAVIGIRRRDGTGPETWVGVPQCVGEADALLRTVVANGRLAA